jgi:predicted CopG family antitoxin
MFKHTPSGWLLLTKTITIRDEVYKKLLKIKREDESFSELFERLVEGMSPSETLKRLRGCVEFKNKDKEKMLSEIYEGRAERRL